MNPTETQGIPLGSRFGGKRRTVPCLRDLEIGQKKLEVDTWGKESSGGKANERGGSKKGMKAQPNMKAPPPPLVAVVA